MLLRSFLTSTVIVLLAAGETAARPSTQPSVAAEAEPLGSPVAGYDIAAQLSHQALLAAIAAWLSANFDFPAPPALPEIVFVSSAELRALRLGSAPRELRTQAAGGHVPQSLHDGHDLVALYSDAERMIYLEASWAMGGAAAQSVLVHEMVHHLQNLGGMQYPCAEAREREAYRAQQRWLALSGRSLESEFAIDPMTLLVRTTCAM